MFISYFDGYKTRNIEAFDINFLYSQVYNLRNEDVLYVAGGDYFNNINYLGSVTTNG